MCLTHWTFRGLKIQNEFYCNCRKHNKHKDLEAFTLSENTSNNIEYIYYISIK